MGVQAQAVGDNHPLIATTLMLWGQACRAVGKLDEALTKFMRVLDIRLGIYKTISNQLCMSALTELCDTLQRARQHHQAAKEYEDMANRFRPSLGASHAVIELLEQRVAKCWRDHNWLQMHREDVRGRILYEHVGMDAEDVRSREQNLVRLMRVLRDKIAVQFFMFYTSKSEGSPEVEFWLVVERFRTLDAEGDEFKKQARSIFLQYIEPPQILKMVTNAERIDIAA